jgi:hypothetical protein
MQLSIPYTFIGPDGTRAVVGNSLEAKQDTDWVGFLDPETGITALLDGADVRTSVSDLVETDGGAHGAFFLSRRVGTVNVIFDPNGSLASVTQAEAKFKRATMGLRSDCVLRLSEKRLNVNLDYAESHGPTFEGGGPRLVKLGSHLQTRTSLALVCRPSR